MKSRLSFVRVLNRRGMILLVSMWMLIILTLFAVGVGFRTSMEVRLSRYALGKTQASWSAQAAVQAALAELQNDAEDSTSKDYDTLYECGVRLSDGRSIRDIFKDIAVGEGSFSVRYRGGEDVPEGKIFVDGMLDEERKININALTSQTRSIFIELCDSLDLDIDAQVVAASIIDWRDGDSNVTDTANGAEDGYYMSLAEPYHCKNMPFQALEELLLVRGMTPDAFGRLKNFLTVFPAAETFLRVNVNTASAEVLRALSRAAVASVPGTSYTDADNLVAKVIEYRRGEDALAATSDDRIVDSGEVPFNINERNLFTYLRNNFLDGTSSLFRIHAYGFSAGQAVATSVEAVVDRANAAVIFWREG